MSAKFPKARICESIGYTQVRFYPECSVCGWYPPHETTHLLAAKVAGDHNAKHHADVPGPVATYKEDVHVKVVKR